MISEHDQSPRAVVDILARLLQAQPALRDLLEQTQLPMVIVDARRAGFPVVHATSAAQALQTDPSRPLVGRTWLDCFPEGQASGIMGLFAEVVRTGEACETPQFTLPAGHIPGAGVTDVDGTTWWRWRIAPLRDPDGVVGSLLVIAVNVTAEVLLERERAEHARVVAQAEMRAAELEAVITGMTDAFWIQDATGRVLTYNASAWRMADLNRDGGGPFYTTAELFQRIEVLDVDGKPFTPAMLPSVHVFSTGQPASVRTLHVRNIRTRREFWVSIAGSPVLDYDGRLIGAAMIARDVTELRQIGALKDTFLSIVAHELRTPLTSIKGYAQLALRQAGRLGTPNPTLETTLTRIVDQVQRLTRLADDLLDVTRAQSGQLHLRLTDCDLAVIVSGCVEEQRLSSDRRIDLVLPGGPIVLRADPDRLRQVVNNLLNNALKYSDPDTSVQVSVRLDNDEAVIAVRDAGPGIPIPEQEAIFALFYRVQGTAASGRTGLGLGLYICRMLVEQHGGRIWVESHPGEGSTFYVALPRQGQELSAAG